MKRILIVEDEPDVADLVADVLDLNGYTSRVESGTRAQDAAVAFQPAAVLLDLMMPGVDGFEVARRLRADERTRTIPIIVMTAMHDAHTRAKEIDSPYFLAKPFDIDALIEAVERATA